MFTGALLIAAQAASPPVAQDQQPKRISIYSNEEQVYFAKEAKQTAPPLVYLEVEQSANKHERAKVKGIDAFGAEVALPPGVQNDVAKSLPAGPSVNDGLFTTILEDGQLIHLRRARGATCWVAILKEKPKADGTPDWFFARDVKLHDQGGRALVGKDVADTKPVVIRMRNVTWQSTPNSTAQTNKPSIVLYVHKPDQSDRAESYAWADPGAARIGINLRWMQASCGIDGAEAPSEVTKTTFRG
jgi:hypothetical protein